MPKPKTIEGYAVWSEKYYKKGLRWDLPVHFFGSRFLAERYAQAIKDIYGKTFQVVRLKMIPLPVKRKGK